MTHPMTAPSEERAAVVRWLRDEAQDLADGEMGKLLDSRWRGVLWALTHPIQWARFHSIFMCLVTAADRIERGEHIRKDEHNAA